MLEYGLGVYRETAFLLSPLLSKALLLISLQLQVFKTLILGDSSVGKTCLAKLFEEEEVVRNAKHTIGLDYFVKDVKLKDGTLVKVSLLLSTVVHVASRKKRFYFLTFPCENRLSDCT